MTDLADRVAKLEQRMDDVEPLARSTDQEVAGWRGVLKNHTELLNTVRDDQVEQGKRLGRLERKVDDGFAKTAVGLDLITKLLTPDPPEEA